MTPDIKALWLAALRSGKYKQTRNKLKNAYGNCCLGVLCEIAKEEGIIKLTHSAEKGTGTGFNDSYEEHRYSPPDSVTEWADLWDYSLIYEGHLTTIGYLNDEEGLTFHQLADLIEQQL